MKRITRLSTLVLLALSTGCVQTTFRLADGTEFKTSRLLWTGNIGEASITSTNGTSAGLKTYTSENAQVAEAIARGVAAGVRP